MVDVENDCGNKKQPVTARRTALVVRQSLHIEINQNAVSERIIERKKRQILNAPEGIVNSGKPDKVRDCAETKQNQQRREPKIRLVFSPETANNQQNRKDQTLQNADKQNDASRIKEIYLHKLPVKNQDLLMNSSETLFRFQITRR